MRDVQNELPHIRLPIHKVGVTNVQKLIIRERQGQTNVLSASIDVFVDLPAVQRGIHMSRSTEVINKIVSDHTAHYWIQGTTAINEVIESTAHKKISDCEDFCEQIARSLLERQETATRAEVVMRAVYSLPRMTPATKIPIQSTYDLYAAAVAERQQSTLRVQRMIGVGVIGLTACPCG